MNDIYDDDFDFDGDDFFEDDYHDDDFSDGDGFFEEPDFKEPDTEEYNGEPDDDVKAEAEADDEPRFNGIDCEDWMVIGPLSEEIAQEKRRRDKIRRDMFGDDDKSRK